MVQLNETEVMAILDKIVADGITNTDLQNGLLDHYCCYIEEKMSQGSDFETAYNDAFKAITPNGMHEIQEELFFLLTFKKQTTMKRVIYGAGFLAAFFISFAFLFIAMRFPGVPFLLITGFSCLLISVGTLFINAIIHARQHPRQYNSRMVTVFIAVLLLSTGIIFKVLYFPGANILFTLGMLTLNFGFIPAFFIHLYKQSVANNSASKAIYCSGFLAAFLLLIGITFKMLHWPSASLILSIGYISLIISATTILFQTAKYTNGNMNVRLLAGFAAAMLISCGTIFKFLQYPSANIQIVLGIFTLNFIFLPLFFRYLYRQSLQKTLKS